MHYLLARARERSTWLGLIAVVTALGVALDPAEVEAVATLGVAAAGAVAALTEG